MFANRILPFVALAICACAPAPEEPARPNILFIFSDDHAYQAISAYGSKINETPNIDRIANAGIRFDRAVVTNSICAPSRAVILTGKYSHVNGVPDNRAQFDGSQQTFPKLLQGAGYQTAIFGKWHLKTAPTGFDAWEVLPGQGAYYNPDMRFIESTGSDGTQVEGKRQHEGYTTDIITDLALDWLRGGRDTEKPFMMMLQHKAPHRNWMPGPDHLAMYDGEDIWEPPTLFDDYAGRASPAANQRMEIDRHMVLTADNKVPADLVPGGIEDTYKQRWERIYNHLTDEQKAAWDAAYGPKNQEFFEAKLTGEDLVRWKYQRYIKDYLRSIASVDDNIGRVLDYLDESGLAENTVVIYNSDQGFYLGEHGWFDKRWMYEESFRSPLVARWPGVTPAGSSSSKIVANVDFAETFLDIAGVPVPDDMHGQSLVPFLKGEEPTEWRESFYYHYYESQVAHGVPEHYGVATERYKLIRYPETDEWELFDLETDPQELKSLYGVEALAEVQTELEAELSRLRAGLSIAPEA